MTTKNMISIPRAIARHFGITPGWKLDWRYSPAPDEIVIKVIPDRATRGRRLMGRGAALSPNTDSVAGLVAERAADYAEEADTAQHEKPESPKKAEA